MAAGSYSASSIPELYSDDKLTTPVTTEEWKVFVITSNVTIEGGYAGSSESETPNYTANATIIDGSAGAAHGLAVAAPKAEGKKVSVKGIKITNFTSPSNNNPARTKDNVYLAGSYGSAIVARGTEVEFEQCIITGNTATAGGKCTVYGAGDGAIITFKDCTISGNTADNGAAANAHGTTVNFTGSTTVSGNTAAANLFQTDATGIIVITDNTIISGNEAANIINNTAKGGITTVSGNAEISANTVATVVSNAGTFVLCDNTVIKEHTGVTSIITNDDQLTIDGAEISSNTSNSNLIINKANASIENATITSNSSTNAGINNVSGSLHLTGCSITDNTFTGTSRGGTFFNQATLYIDKCDVSGNSSVGFGSVLYSYKTTETYNYITNSSFTGNTATGTSESTGRYAMYFAGPAKGIIANCTFYNNVEGAPDTTKGQGTIMVNNTCTMYIISSTIVRNTAYDYGGLYYQSSTPIYLYNSLVAGNTATTAHKDTYAAGLSSTARRKCALGWENGTYGRVCFYDDSNAYKYAVPTGESNTLYVYDGTYLGSIKSSTNKTQVIPIKAAESSHNATYNLISYGMTSAQLTALSIDLGQGVWDSSILAYDQAGNSRAGLTTIGAYVGE